MNVVRGWKWLVVVMAALLVMGALAGCRGKDDDQAPEQAPAAGAAAEVATEVTSPADSGAAEAQAVDANATATTEAQLAALADGESAAEEPEQPAAAAVEEPVDLNAQVVQGICNHPYYPIRDGAVYRYRTTSSGEEPVEMTTQYRVTGPDSFVTVQSFEGITSEMSWRCTEEGLLSTDFGLNNADIPGVDFNMDAVSGVTFPLPENLQVGNTWQSVFTMSGQMSMEGMAINMNMDATTDSVMTGFEQVSTPAGTYEAAKIDSSTTVNMQMDMGESGAADALPGMPGISMASTIWLAEGVGMVRTESGDPAGGLSVTELVAIE